MKICIIAFTENGKCLSLRIKKLFAENDVYCIYKDEIENVRKWTGEAFEKADIIVFVSAAGIAVRSIAPWIKGKDIDPAVIVCDERGKFVIPILSGHIGGGNKTAEYIADGLGAVCVITTATDINNVWAADVWATERGYAIADIGNIKYISARLLAGGKIGVESDVADVTIEGIPEEIIDNDCRECGIAVSPFLKKPFDKTLNIIPKCLYLGVGSKKGADENALIELFEELAEKYGIDKRAVCGVATVELKKDEACVTKLCEYLNVKLQYFSTDELKTAKGEFTESEFVKNTVGVGNVCERSATLASKGKIVIKKTKKNGTTIAAAIKKFHTPK